MFDKKEKEILIELICNEQTHMIIENPESYNTLRYKQLEELKVKIKDDNVIKPVALLEIKIPEEDIDNAIKRFMANKKGYINSIIDDYETKSSKNKIFPPVKTPPKPKQ